MQVILFYEHQLTDNIRPSAEELKVVAQLGGFHLRRKGTPCGVSLFRLLALWYWLAVSSKNRVFNSPFLFLDFNLTPL